MMDLKRFTPRWLNAGGAFLITAIWWAVNYSLVTGHCARINCIAGDGPCAAFFFEILPSCCSCYTTATFAQELLWVIIIPLIGTYFALSFIMIENGRKK